MTPKLTGLAAIVPCVLVAAGCGNEHLLDVPPELPGVAYPSCELVAQAYRIDDLVLPATVGAALQVSLNLDDDPDGRPDNAAGTVLATFAGQYEGRLEQLTESVRAALADGRVRWVVVVETCADSDDDYARVTLQRASDLDGDGVLRVIPYGYVPAVGDRLGDRVRAREGTAAAPISALFDVLGTWPEVEWVDGYAFAIHIDGRAADGSISGRFGLGLDDRAFAAAAGPLAVFYTELLAIDGSELAIDMDVDEDGVVTPDELMANELMLALAAPDLDLVAEHDGAWVYWPLHDGARDSTSMGLGFTAVPVALE